MTGSNMTAIERFGQGFEDARRFAQASKADATKRAYRSDWARFVEWCHMRGCEALPATPEQVAVYVAELAGVRAYATIARYVASISTAHRVAGQPSPITGQVREVLAGIRRTVGVKQHKREPVRVAHLRKACALAGRESAADIRDLAILLVGYAGAFRRSELATLRIEDVKMESAGAVVTLRRSKTDQESKGVRKGIPCGAHPETCPVRALAAWLDVVGETSGPLFRRVDKWGHILPDAITGQSVALVVKRWAERLGLDPADVSGHSLRAGLVTDAFGAGLSESVIMGQTGHRSSAVLGGYRREANLFRQNPAAAVGL